MAAREALVDTERKSEEAARERVGEGSAPYGATRGTKSGNKL